MSEEQLEEEGAGRASPPLSPREFLRGRRPEKFSDSIQEETPILDRSILEYHLDTLTNRNQATDFEQFARMLAEHEICPNLLPQTGPTGGGDSKVDSETYPVADGLAAAWFTGIGREAASERWAFAFSAKRDWRSKVRSDVAKIATTDRDYRKAFFITNQYVPDRQRAEVEDSLSKAHGIDVRILDRSWILDRVFARGLEEVTIQQLGLSVPVRAQRQRGPLDLQRTSDLEQIESGITAVCHEGRQGLQYVSDCIEAAELSRALDLPRAETDGRFLRAKRASTAHGSEHQRLLAAYQHAWTTFWWYEDYDEFARLYTEVEEHARGTCNAYDLELLANLWMVLHSFMKRGEIDAQNADLTERTAFLHAELDRLSHEDARPSAVLQAQTLRLQMSLHSAIASGSDAEVDRILLQLRDVVLRCEGLLGFPLDPLVQILSELSEFLGDRPAFDELFASIVEVARRRDGDLSAARLLCKQGHGQLEADRPYDAIRTLGRALAQLYTHKSRKELASALCLCGYAYERVGLLWAARGSQLAAASILTNEFWTYADVTSIQAACYERMKWLEIQLGRVPQALSWHEIDSLVRSVLVDQGYESARIFRGEMEFAAILGILFLRCDIGQLKQLAELPSVLDELGLEIASTALRFALGHTEGLPEAFVGDATDPASLHALFTKWRDQPASQDIPEAPSLCEGTRVTFQSRLLGCLIAVESDNISPCIELAESLLAGLESLLATGTIQQLAAREPALRFSIHKTDFGQSPFSFELTEPDGEPCIVIRCTDFNPHAMPPEEHAHIRDRIFEVLALAMGRVFLHGDPESLLTTMFRDERAAERASNFTSSFVTLGNVLGHSPKASISAWCRPGSRAYPLERWEEWDAPERKAKQEEPQEAPLPEIQMGKGAPPAMIDGDRYAKHTEMQTVSLIREALWNDAKWAGTAFIWDEKHEKPPILALVFRNPDPAAAIFHHWYSEVGREDRQEKLRISIIRHISKAHPHSYRVMVGINPSVALSRPGVKRFVMISRQHKMVPDSDLNLTKFLQSYGSSGRYFLGFAIQQDERTAPEFSFQHCIAKGDLFVRDAWEIGRNDPDTAGIDEDDDPIIPVEQADAPVLALLEWRRQMTRGSSA